jgi:DNA (cytosine-5)-methyltransferase 1
MEFYLMLRTIDLFAGIGGIRLGFESVQCKTIFASEWDKDAQKIYYDNFGEIPEGDITKINSKDIPDHDILLAGFPYQPFSIIGNLQGFLDTRGTLFFNIEEILRAKQPYAFLLENVKQLKTHNQGQTFATIIKSLESLGYFVFTEVLNALDFGLPQKRERTFIVGFKENLSFHFPKPFLFYQCLEKILENDSLVDPKLFASEKIIKNRREKLKKEPFYPSIWHENKGGNISVLPYSCALRAGGSYNYLLVNGIRRPSSKELLKLQGFPESFKFSCNYSTARRLTGNSVAVSVIQAIAKEMLKSINQRQINQNHKQLFLL